MLMDQTTNSKTVVLPNWYTDSNNFLSKYQLVFYRHWQTDLKIHTEMQEAKNIQNNPEKEQQSWSSYFLLLKKLLLSFQQWSRQWNTDTDINQIRIWEFRNKTTCLRTKDAKTIQWRKEDLFNKWVLNNRIAHKKMVLGTSLAMRLFKNPPANEEDTN